jgi:hypothetical protein
MRHHFFISILVALTFSACENQAEYKDRQSVQKQQEYYSIAQPIPRFDYSLDRDVATQLYQECNKKVTTHAEYKYSIAQPIPKFAYSLDRDVADQLYQECNKKVATHAELREDKL